MADTSPSAHANEPTGRPSRLAVAALVLTVALSTGFLLLGPMRAGTVVADTSMFTDPQKRGIEQIVKEYLLQNPQVLIEVQGALEQRMAQDEADRTKALVAENAKEIYRHPDAPVAGNPEGDITVVEFFDYNCGYCKRGFHNIRELIEKDSNVRVVFKELPILSKDSEEAAKIALAARAQGKYWELHQALIDSKGRVTEAFALETAGKLGLDVEKLKADKDSDAVKGELARVEALARKMNITGTPHFLVGSEAIGGAPEDLLDQLTAKIATLRKSGCAYC